MKCVKNTCMIQGRCAYPTGCIGITHAPPWTGPKPNEIDATGRLVRAPVPPERWPYGPPEAHQSSCRLHVGGLFCDCAASCADDSDFGVAP